MTQFDIATEFTSHTHACTTNDVKDMMDIVHNCNSICILFPISPGLPLKSQTWLGLLHTSLTPYKQKLFADATDETTDDQSSGEDSSNEQFSDDSSDEQTSV